MRISMRLLLLFLLVAVLPLALFSYLSLKQSEKMLRDQKQLMLSDLADKKAIQVKSYLAERVQDVRFLVRGPRVIGAIDILAAEHAAGRRAAAAYAREDKETRQYFDRYVEESGLFYDVFLITPQGEVAYSQRHEADFATNLLTGPYRDTQLAQVFNTARMTLESAVSGYAYHAPSQMPALFIAAPIMIDGRFKGVFAVQLGNDLLFRVAGDATGLGLSGEASFAQRDGDGVLYTTPLKYHADAAMKHRLNLSQIKATAMFEALSGESGAGVIADYRGKQVVAAWRYVPELDWGMVVKIDAGEVLEPVARQRKLLLLVLLGCLLFSGIAAYFFGRQISMPLRGLARIAGEVSRGGLDKRADESAPGELGLFARAFNRMTENLQALYRSLEDRVDERTRELNVSNEQLQEEIIEREHIEATMRENQVELQHNQDLLNEAQQLGKLGSWELDLASNELSWSDEIYRIFELDPAQFTPSYENFLNVVHPDDRDRVNQAYTQSLEDRQPYDITHRLRLADGRIKWVREHCTSEFDASGKALRSVGAVQDITEQKLAEDQLRVAAATFETHEAILITDANANIIRVNRAFEDITGYSAEEVLGKNTRILSSGHEGKTFYAAMWQQLLSAGTWSGEMWDRHKNGHIYPKYLTITAIKNERGETTEYVGIFSNIIARKRAEEEIRTLAFYDVLTKLPNRRLLLDRFHLALSVSARSNLYGAVMFLDMDRFKTLNDTMGHDYGDLLLIEVAQRIQYCVREVDTVARLGGDEFVVLIEEIDGGEGDASQKVALIAEKIRAALAAPYQIKEQEYHSSPSIGVCLYRGTAESVEEVLKHADLAMYQAKDAGRNAVRFFDPAMQQAVEIRAVLEKDLRHAVFDGQLRLYYQIQVDNEQRALGAEALVRWIHPERGMVSPAQFISVAEESSLILDIGHWVLETACRQLAQWGKRERTRDLVLSVNVSAQQFRKHDFVEKVAVVIRAHQVDPARLKLELTESVVLTDIADIVVKMYALKALGVGLSMDDFGTGYSSLSYLKQLPLDQLKIDQSFVRDIATDSNDAAMVKAIIDMALNFRLNVIAEGVETGAQLAFLKQHGCMAYQGYLFGKPVPVEEFEMLLGGGDL